MDFENFKYKFAPRDGTYIYVQTDTERDFGRDLIRWISRKWRPPRWFFHLRKGGHVAAAASHLGSLYFAKLDLAHFFDDVSRTKIHRSLKRVGFSHRSAYEFACRSTVEKTQKKKDYSAPFGFVQSPLLASLALHDSALGRQLKQFASSRYIRLSVYVDDIIVSTAENSSCLSVALDAICDACERSNFTINTAKTVAPSERLQSFNLDIESRGLRISNQRFALFAERIIASRSENEKADILSYANSVNADQARLLREAVLNPHALNR